MSTNGEGESPGWHAAGIVVWSEGQLPMRAFRHAQRITRRYGALGVLAVLGVAGLAACGPSSSAPGATGAAAATTGAPAPSRSGRLAGRPPRPRPLPARRC